MLQDVLLGRHPEPDPGPGDVITAERDVVFVWAGVLDVVGALELTPGEVRVRGRAAHRAADRRVIGDIPSSLRAPVVVKYVYCMYNCFQNGRYTDLAVCQ